MSMQMNRTDEIELNLQSIRDGSLFFGKFVIIYQIYISKLSFSKKESELC